MKLHIYRPPSEGWGKEIVSVCSHFGRGGGPGLRFSGGGGVPGLRFLEGGGGGVWVLVSVKGKIFDTRFGLMHVQTGKKNFFC